MSSPQVLASLNTVPLVTDFYCEDYNRMRRHWELIDDLNGGTDRMRQAGEKWLPKEDGETPEQYTARLLRTFLFPAYSDTVSDLSAKPFSKPVTINGEKPEWLPKFELNCDLKGSSLTQFMGKVFQSGVNYGLCHMIVDFPVTTRSDGTKITDNLAEEIKAGVRPYVAMVEAPDMLTWDVVYENSMPVLDSIYFREIRVEKTGNAIVPREALYIRQYTRTTWKLWKYDPEANKKQGGMVDHSSGEHSLGVVPIATFYSNESKFMAATPPLEGLAWLNLEHWQTTSQQRNALHYARIPMLLLKGIAASEMEKQITLGANRIFKTISSDADMKWVEHTGQAIKAGQEDIDKLEGRMQVLGLKPLMENSGDPTATARAIDTSDTNCAVQEWVRNMETAALKVLMLAAMWNKETLKTEGEGAISVSMFQDFGITLRGAEDGKDLLAARIGREIDHQTFIGELKRRGTLASGVDAKVVRERLDKEPPPEGTLDNPGSEPAPNKRVEPAKGSSYKNGGE